MSLLSTSVTSRQLKGENLLVYGKCIEVEFPDILRRFSQNRIPLSVCMETVHMNVVGFKLLNIIRLSKIKSLTILTPDGSPHCIQLHYIGEHIKRALGESLPIKHFVIEKGKVFEIPIRVVRLSRHLSECNELMFGAEANE
ncbi:MAG: 4Fe-4S ferredoxin [archaeon GB-1867-035]|nr:4Fe-4S ferredoxin [Candidatus Culexmicrobium profundum]